MGRRRIMGRWIRLPPPVPSPPAPLPPPHAGAATGTSPSPFGSARSRRCSPRRGRREFGAGGRSEVTSLGVRSPVDTRKSYTLDVPTTREPEPPRWPGPPVPELAHYPGEIRKGEGSPPEEGGGKGRSVRGRELGVGFARTADPVKPPGGDRRMDIPYDELPHRVLAKYPRSDPRGGLRVGFPPALPRRSR